MKQRCRNKINFPATARQALFLTARTVFQHKPAKAAVEKVEKKSDFAKMAEEREKRVNEPNVNADTGFTGNFGNDIDKLSKEAYSLNKAEQTRYKEKIAASLKHYLKEDKTPDDLWKWLADQKCNVAAIIKGILRFFRDEVDKETAETRRVEIDIAGFLKPQKIEAESGLHKTLVEAHESQLTQTRADLKTLLAELKAQHPDLPELTA